MLLLEVISGEVKMCVQGPQNAGESRELENDGSRVLEGTWGEGNLGTMFTAASHDFDP